MSSILRSHILQLEESHASYNLKNVRKHTVIILENIYFMYCVQVSIIYK